MSYNIDNINCIVLNASMKARDIKRLYKKHDDELPEINFLQEVLDKAAVAKPDDMIQLTSFEWSGEGSGWSYNLLVEKIAPFIHGSIEAVLTWEGGDSVDGLIINNGKVTKCDVEQRLIPNGK